MQPIRFGTLLAAVLALSACAWLDARNPENTEGMSASDLYNAGQTALANKDYEQAIRFYEVLEGRFPFGRYAQQAQLETIYAYYKFDEPESAIAAADRFIRLNPRHPHVDYAYYVKGLVNYDRNFGPFVRYLPQDRSRRDPASAREAFFAFQELVTKFPDSRYAEDARKRMVYLRNMLARHEVHVARYYMKRGAYVAAVNRAKFVLEHYDRSPAVPHALQVMADAYEKMEMSELAADTRRVYAHNFPDYELQKKGAYWWWPFK